MKWKKDINIVTNFEKSILAGMLIGLGVVINLQTTTPFIGALLFSFGLLTIIYLQLPLYTGKIGFLGKNLPLILLGNLIGVAVIAFLYCLCQIDFLATINAAARSKFAKTYSHMLIGGILCGMLIHFAVRCKEAPYIVSMAVIIFILIGAEHCVADFPYLLFNLGGENIFKFLLVIFGNSIGAVFVEKIISS